VRVIEGQVLDERYRMVRRIGSGGMADVWLADDTELGRQVALKILHENFARDTEFVARFQREASAAAALQHQNVVGVFDRGQVEDTYYIAMEFVDGSPLRDLIKRGLSNEESIEITRQILAAAEFAHGRGIVHRDLKPMNVLIDREGRIRVTDFGIARAGGSEITQTGSVMGTAQYLSPEQAQGLDVTATSDVYSVGVMLFEMLTGRVPFDGDNAVAIAMKQVSEQPPPPSQINPNVTPALDAVVLRALAKDPAARYPTAAAMRDALDEAEAHPDSGPRTEVYAPLALPEEEEEDRRKGLWVVAVIVALLAAGALVWALTRGEDTVKVPGVENETETAARIELQAAGFVVRSNVVESNVPEGRVVSQDPLGGTEAEEGSTVTIDVSAGPDPISVPDLSGKSLEFARSKLTKAGFEVDVERRPSRSVRRGRVIETDPPAGAALDPGATVTLLVSAGTETVTVPSVVGMNRIDAAAAIEDAGLVANLESENADEPEGQVIRQIPAAGTALPEGDQVTVVYSTGAGSILLGNYVGLEESSAVDDIEDLGLVADVRTQTVESESDDGVVLSQSPPSGSRLGEGDRVSLVVGEYVEPEPEPEPTTTTPDDEAPRRSGR
jgi:beta-lactam-binding protein with PASTA domain